MSYPYPPVPGNAPYGGYPQSVQMQPTNYPPAQINAAGNDPYGGYPQPVQIQPTNYPPLQTNAPGGWGPQPQMGNSSSPGLEYLTQVDQLLIKQKVELLEAITTFETKNKYNIKNAQGQKVYYAKEDTDCLTRNCCGPYRPFDLKIFDTRDTEVIHLNRPLACDSCWFPCCLQSIEVTSPPGNVIGSVEQNWSMFSPDFSIKDASGNTVLKIEGPFCTWSICGAVEFKVMSADGQTQVGKISKQWSGLLREMFTDTDYFGITFPIDLDVRIKAVLMGATFLIDFMFFEKKGRESNDGIGMFG